MRRALAFALFLLAALPACAQTRAWNFRVFLDGRDIGHHTFTLRTQGETRELRSEARFEVGVLLFSAYHYVHDATERWRGECLQALSSRTDDNGEQASVDWKAKEGECAISFAYWNPRMLLGKLLLNAQTGKFVPVEIIALGEESVEVRGRPLNARRHRLTGPKMEIDLWYAGEDWVALESAAKGGRRSNAVWGLQFIWPIQSHYRIVYVSPDYAQTVVGREARDYAWIMARTPAISDADYEHLCRMLAAQGYDLSRLRKVPQRWT